MTRLETYEGQKSRARGSFDIKAHQDTADPVISVDTKKESGTKWGRLQRVGYIRVSSLGQNPVRQLEGVEADTVFTDTVSGKSADRPQLQAMLRFARAGDTIIVHSMDRLARNLMTCAAWYASSPAAACASGS